MIGATIFIPLFNGEEFLEQLLKACLEQKVDFEYEILIIDSGSKDSSLDIVKKFQQKHHNLRLHEIPNSEFGHGKTRNLAAKMGKGKYMAFLTQDAIPYSKNWLKEMTAPFEFNERVVAVFGKQIPRADCMPPTKRDIIDFFNTFGPNHSISVQEKGRELDEKSDSDSLMFFSDVNSAVNREFLLSTIPYQNLAYSEDQAFGREVIEAGYLKVYTPFGAVEHSHSYNKVTTYFKRMFDEYRGLRISGADLRKTGIIRLPFRAFRNIFGDYKFIIRDKTYSLSEKLIWTLKVPIYAFAKYYADYLVTHSNLERLQQSNLSLEKSLKKAHKRENS